MDVTQARPVSSWDESDWIAKKFEVKDAFSPAAPINEADHFSGRSTEITRLIDAVFERGRHPILFGERGVGKTSLGNTFHKLIGDAASRSVFPIWYQITPDDDFSSIWKSVFEQIMIQYEDDAGNTKQERLSEKYEKIRPGDVVRELKSTSDGKNKVIILDEYDNLTDAASNSLIPHTMKALSDRGANATIMLIGVADSIDSLVENHASVSRNITEIKMPRMDEPEAELLILERTTRLGINIKTEAKWKIIILSRGLPSYLHQLSRDSILEALENKSLTVTEDHVDQAIRLLATQSDQSIYAAYSKAVSSNNSSALFSEVLLACAMAKSDDLGQFRPSDVIEPLSKILGRKIEISNFSSQLSSFLSEKRGFVLERRGAKRAYKYRFLEPKMQPYVIMRGIADGNLREDALSILSPPIQPSLPLSI